MTHTDVIPGAFVAGGAITSIFTAQPVNDVDIYFKSREAFEEAVKDSYDVGDWCVDVSKRAVTFANGPRVMQFMHFDFFPNAAAIFDAFDFTCCMGAFDFDADEFVLHDDFMRHCAQRFLRFHPGTRYPLASATRILKYQDRGYTIGKGDILRIVLAARRVKIDSWEDLRDQIGGAYGDKVVLNGENQPFSIDAAIAALHPNDVWAPKNDRSQPGCAEALFARIADLKGEPELMQEAA
jgi:hypothetical protein